MSETTEREAVLLAEIDRLRAILHKQADWAEWAKGNIDRLREDLRVQADWEVWAKAEIDRLRAAIERVQRPPFSFHSSQGDFVPCCRLSQNKR